MNHFFGNNQNRTSNEIPEFDFLVVRYKWSVSVGGADLDTYTSFTGTGTSIDDSYVGFQQGILEGSGPERYVEYNGIKLLRWAGDDVGANGGTEAVLVDFLNADIEITGKSEFRVDLRTLWFNGLINGDFFIELEAYLGGTMSIVGKDFVNTGGSSVFKNTFQDNTQVGQGIPGELQGYVTYDTATKEAILTKV